MFGAHLLAQCAYWAERAREYVSDERVPYVAALLARGDARDHRGFLADESSAIVGNELATLVRHAEVLGADVGTIDAVRSAHTWLRPMVDAPISERYSAVPDADEATKAVVKVGHNKRGATRKVVRHGRAVVVGSCDTSAPAWTRESTIASVLADVPFEQRDSLGRARALDIGKVTHIAYGEMIPPLLGGDTTSWSEVVYSDESAIDRFGVAIHTVGGTLAGTARPLKAWPTRYKVGSVKVRNAERGDTHELISASSTPGRVFIGHRAIERQQTVHGKRVAWSARVDNAFIGNDEQPLPDAIAPVLRTLERGKRYSFTHRDSTLTCSLSPSGTYSVRVNGEQIKGRTIIGVTRKLSLI